jgi:hypothetical protein
MRMCAQVTRVGDGVGRLLGPAFRSKMKRPADTQPGITHASATHNSDSATPHAPKTSLQSCAAAAAQPHARVRAVKRSGVRGGAQQGRAWRRRRAGGRAPKKQARREVDPLRGGDAWTGRPSKWRGSVGGAKT